VKRFVLVSLATAFFATATTVATAGYWKWPASGYGTLTSGTVSGTCWYNPGAVCSGWNYWCNSFLDKSSGGVVLHGYENSERIRGHFLSAGEDEVLLPQEVSMGGYLKSSTTWWSDPSSVLWTDVDNEFVCA
jgi:hypothetical protein